MNNFSILFLRFRKKKLEKCMKLRISRIFRVIDNFIVLALKLFLEDGIIKIVKKF